MRARCVDGAKELGARPGTTLVVIGNFDGAHRGHQTVLASSVAEAERLGLAPTVLTFDPHPSEVVGATPAAVLTTLERKVELICRADPRLTVVVEPFTRELSQKTPDEFARELLLGALGARVVIVGQNFRFGHQRAGDLERLRELGRELGFEAHAQELSGDELGPYSSTRVRAALAAGDLAMAEALLGRPHALSGVVVRGDGRGRSIGVPTANIGAVAEALPPYGVYSCLVDRLAPDGARVLGAGVANIGVRPTVAAGFSVEVHLFDLDEDLYGQKLRLHLVGRLRDEKRFSGLDELTAQIRRDIADARRQTAVRSPSPDAAPAWY
ncbi:MAG TPA: bifunctional riboflavin kinase/FAD synthetase [Polyangiaceae bacterium]|nr:bifunctional riboflavin kinase/FAD synthetase [Polyangiaceae bacterium]